MTVKEPFNIQITNKRYCDEMWILHFVRVIKSSDYSFLNLFIQAILRTHMHTCSYMFTASQRITHKIDDFVLSKEYTDTLRI